MEAVTGPMERKKKKEKINMYMSLINNKLILELENIFWKHLILSSRPDTSITKTTLQNAF
jgi:hypothetical protein